VVSAKKLIEVSRQYKLEAVVICELQLSDRKNDGARMAQIEFV